MNDIQRVSVKKGVRCVHIETELGIVNIYVGLHDFKGRRVESIRVIPDEYYGERRVHFSHASMRFIELKSVVRGGKL